MDCMHGFLASDGSSGTFTARANARRHRVTLRWNDQPGVLNSDMILRSNDTLLGHINTGRSREQRRDWKMLEPPGGRFKGPMQPEHNDWLHRALWR